MNSNRITPLTPLLSSLAILSFKKKSKGGGELGGLSTSMDDLNLDGENLSLSDLGGSVGSLSMLEKKDKKGKDGGLDDNLLAGLTSSGPRADDKKFSEIEASVNDLKKHAESADVSSKATKGEIESMKKDLSQINDNIKNLLNVYEAVSRQYNPFVDSDMPTKAPIDTEPVEEEVELGSNISLGSLTSLSSLPDKKVKELDEEVSVDELGPLDRIVKPDDEEEEEFSSLMDLQSPLMTEALRPNVVPEPEPTVAPLHTPEPAIAPKTKPRTVASVDIFVLEQVHKLVEHQMSKIYRARLVGDVPDQDDVETLDRWMCEFKRLGGG